MSLFEELRRLHRKDRFELEDFHTEIVAQVLQNSHPLMLEWLHSLGATPMKRPTSITIRTQVRFEQLQEDQPGSRVDIVIWLSENEQREMIFVESKIDSTENPGQLEKYADVIALQEGFGKTAIIYITRDFEIPKPRPTITTRWSDFYQHLKAHVNGDGLARELKLFMEENKMAVRNQFTALDTLALSNFLSAKALLDETLWGEVSTKFEKILGKVSPEASASSQLRNYNRYIMFVAIGTRWDFECLLGYWLPNGDPGEPPWLGVELGVNPKSQMATKLVAALRDFAKKNPGWNNSRLDNEEWPLIGKRRRLSGFMGESDHLKAIRDYFSSLLDDVARFRSANPQLPWSTRSAEAGDE